MPPTGAFLILIACYVLWRWRLRDAFVRLRWHWWPRRLFTLLLHRPITRARWRVVEADAVPAGLRTGLDDHASDLVALGFAPCGYLQLDEIPEHPRHLLVLRDPETATFAIVSFAAAPVFNGNIAAPVTFWTLFADGAWIATVNGQRHLHFDRFPRGCILDALTPSLERQCDLHLEMLEREAERDVRDADLDALREHLDGLEDEYLKLLVELGHATPTGSPAVLRRTPFGARYERERNLAGSAMLLGSFVPRGDPRYRRVPVEAQEQVYQEYVWAEDLDRSTSRTLLTLGVSALAFLGLTLLLRDGQRLAWLLPAVAFHEFGHWAAMRLLGHRDATVFFVPLLGGATFTRRPFHRLWHEVAVLLAGPVPGLAVGLLLLRLPVLADSTAAHEAAWTFLVLNVFNLLPLYPLDGGRLLHALVTAGRPRFRFAMECASSLAFLVVAVALRSLPLGAIGLAGLLILRRGDDTAELDASIRAHPEFSPALPAETRRAFVFRALTGTPRANVHEWVKVVRRLERTLHHATPTLSRALPGALVYGACLAGIVAIFARGVLTFESPERRCPEPWQGAPISCGGAFADVDWERPSFDMVTTRFEESTGGASKYPLNAFVWCTTDDSRAATLAREVADARPAWPTCAALPWARDGSKAPAERDTCAELLIRYVMRWNPLDKDSSPSTLFAVSLASRRDFAGFGAYLCRAGCRLRLLPVGAFDPRLDACE
jgi:Zn-dependent protease